jgi:hypothetical protein
MATIGFEFDYECTIEPARNVNRCRIREKKTAKVRCERDFRVQPGNRYAANSELGPAVGFDGENLRVRNDSGREVTLVPLLPCKAED